MTTTMEEVDSLELNEELANQAYLVFGETPKLRHEKLQQLRERIKRLPNQADQLKDLSDKNLIRFLRSKRFCLDETLKSTIEYQHFLDTHQESLQNITSEEILYFKDVFTVFQEPKSSQEGLELSTRTANTERRENDERQGNRIMLILNLKKLLSKLDSSYKLKNPYFMIRLSFIFEQLSFNPYSQIYGIILIISCHNLTLWEQMTLTQLASIPEYLACFQHFRILGTKFKGAYLIEEPPFLSWLWYFVSPILSEKIRNRCHFCGSDYSKVQAAVSDLRILPKSLGGERDDDDYGDWLTRQCKKVLK